MSGANCPICGHSLHFAEELISFTKLGCENCDASWFFDTEKGLLTFNMNANIQAYHHKCLYADAV